eukprot:m.206889 g.206889  ORF g.206889 m.206889 type:complete len:97 (+) comp15027_c2_seq22:3349-3639(+)
MCSSLCGGNGVDKAHLLKASFTHGGTNLPAITKRAVGKLGFHTTIVQHKTTRSPTSHQQQRSANFKSVTNKEANNKVNIASRCEVCYVTYRSWRTA